MQQMITLVTFVLFTGLVGLLTWRITRRQRLDTSEGYFLAGRSLTAGFIAGSLLLTNLSTEQLVGLNADAYKDGLSVMAWEVIAGLSLVVMALYFLPKYLRSGITTIPEFLEQRYDGITRVLTTLLFIVAYAGILLPMILYTGATGLEGILDLPELTGIRSYSAIIWLAVWFIGIIGSIYAIFGGLRTVAVSDTLNGFGLLVGGFLITYLGLQAVSDEGVFAALTELRTAHPEKFNSLGRPDQSVPFSTLFTGVLLINLFYWTTNQQIIQRTFGASSLAEGQKGVLLAGLFKILAPLILVLPGIIAFYLAQQGRIDLTVDGEVKTARAYGQLVDLVLPAPLRGFFAAVLVGAILSSFNSALNSTATLFSLGVYKAMLHPDATDAQVIRSGKIAGAVVAVIAMTLAPLLIGQESIFQYLQSMNGIYFIPIFAVVLVGMLFPRVPAPAAWLALTLGPISIILGYFVPPFTDWVSSINGFHFLALVFVSLVLLMLGIGLFAPLPTPWKQTVTDVIDLTPWRWAWPVGLGLTAVVILIYAYFAEPT